MGNKFEENTYTEIKENREVIVATGETIDFRRDGNVLKSWTNDTGQAVTFRITAYARYTRV